MEEKEKTDLEKQKSLAIAYQALGNSKEGKIILDDLFNFANHNEDTFNPDANIMAYSAGQRSVTIRISKILNVSIKALESKMNEQEKEKSIDEKSAKEVLND